MLPGSERGGPQFSCWESLTNHHWDSIMSKGSRASAMWAEERRLWLTTGSLHFPGKVNPVTCLDAKEIVSAARVGFPGMTGCRGWQQKVTCKRSTKGTRQDPDSTTNTT